ncbi:peptidoglycan DD-metalloendopeptidase family protein [Ponticoccus sp. SC2-23]|uniref:M23 family metallopeptidase n=1 Tax=Alexandriicola marinus TaxID=2081710 RepID=UPI000FDAD479|nr:M23 family metallopeptidase [Alexandriicola marinus]MBM1219303.1 peptidoglycan DD-metalloendopeptidase family protein [Ponticoccus sp. SC6-9]MBM1223625.1 peptidoglycan DD-metalloendopeptidase family protein [Ponticoccus sp. SC6-15]MBM1229116.1 peptidoglycan DD-metalloendopeptidase family protein [Ponticoccus sp. SC6-38]MBM1232591.1 peptidoglycan DD-metalloendopeptidase family protein [Ponticoccus sp. SC6-45]MBM1237459.1 peptidoglycan DD-metalloendopeptidase family protein [Ponticoccus sp. S
MRTRAGQILHTALEKRFPEKRLFLRSDTETRFIRLKSETQLIAWAGSVLVVGWAIVATAIILMDSIGAGNFRAQAQRDKMIYEERLSAISSERDNRAAEAIAAQQRFNSALEQISIMQTELLASEDRRRELETGLEVVHATMSTIMREREALKSELATVLASADDGNGLSRSGAVSEEMNGTVEILADALAQTAAERDLIAADAEFAIDRASELELELRLMEDRNDEIFRQLEEAMLVSVEPLDNMFRAAGLNTDNLIEQVRRGYSGTGGPLTPLSFSTMGGEPDPQAERANRILDSMDRINLYRIAAERAPFDMPVKSNFRFTSGFGMRWGRLHAGTDFAAPIGTPIYATADGVVTSAGWSSGYGRLIKIQHEFGIETRYAHLNAIRVEVGQRVSRGQRIGDMGNSGRSTGPHLHYEVRVGGEPVNPMIYIRAGRDVF